MPAAHPQAAPQFEAAVTAQANAIRAGASALPRVNVASAQFGAGCPNAADPSGRLDSTCAIRHAQAFAESQGPSVSGYPVLYFPRGRYLVAGQGLAPALTFTHGISLEGDGPGASILMNTSPTAGTVAFNRAGECAGKAGPCFVSIRNLTFAGRGHTSMGGLIELNSTDTGLMENVVLAETGGIALNVQGNAERWIFRDMEITHARWPILTEGDTNEDYFDRVNVIDAGLDAGHFCFSVNCPGGRLPAANATWLPDPHSAVYLDGDNLHFMNASIKSTMAMGGIRLSPTTSSISHVYIEGYPWGGQPRVNHAIAVGGKQELGHLTAAISADALEIPVDDAGWQPRYVNNPADVRVNEHNSYVNAFGIYPADYKYKSNEPSRAVPGITRGTMEWVEVAAFAGDGQAHLSHRGTGGTRPIAWPAGSVIEQTPTAGYGEQTLNENHLNSLDPQESKGQTANGCNDTAQRTDAWTSSPSLLCGEILAGYVPDGFALPTPGSGGRAPHFSLSVSGNSIYTGEDETLGQGWIKVADAAYLTLDQGDVPLHKLPSAPSAYTTYNNGTKVQAVQYPGGASAALVLHDLGANLYLDGHSLQADVNPLDGSIDHVYTREQCWYALPDGGAQPSSRFCIRPSGPAQETLVNGRWVAAPAR